MFICKNLDTNCSIIVKRAIKFNSKLNYHCTAVIHEETQENTHKRNMEIGEPASQREDCPQSCMTRIALILPSYPIFQQQTQMQKKRA
jgi:hypothetical protein